MSLLTYSNIGLFDFQRCHYPDSYSQGYHLLASVFRVPILDRTGKMETGFNAVVSHPIPKRGKVGTFADICDVRATKLMNEAEERDKIIDVHWSGGIDSTVALTAFIRNALDDDYSRLRVVLTPQSIEEYPRFYNEFIKGKINTLDMNDVPNYKQRQYFIDEGNITVTGELGDQIFGSDTYLMFSEKIENPALMRATGMPASLMRDCMDIRTGDFSGIKGATYEKYLPVLINMIFGDNNPYKCRHFADKIIEHMQPMLDAAPFKIKSLVDFLWWINFTQKWTYVFYRTTHTNWTPIGVETSDFRPFFDTDEFQKWSMNANNHKNKCRGDDISGYKMIAKEYVHLLTKDDEYRDTKLKLGSLRLAVPDQLGDITAVNYLFTDDHALHSFNTNEPKMKSVFEGIFK